MDGAKRKIKELGYDVLGLKEVQYINAGVDPGTSCTKCTSSCKPQCINCVSCDMGGERVTSFQEAVTGGLVKFVNIIVFFLFLVSFGYGSDGVLKDIHTGRSIQVDKEGNLYTSKNQHTIQKYSPSGKFLLEFGRRGRGPGDIQRLGRFAIHPLNQNIYVTEFYGGNPWISIFSAQGKFIDTWDTKLNHTEWQALYNIKFDNDGNAYIMVEKSVDRVEKGIGVARSDNRIIKFKPDGTIERTIYRLIVDDSAIESETGMYVTIPFHNGFFFDVLDKLIAVNEAHHNYIQLFSTDGKLIKKLMLPYEKEKVSQADIDEWEKSMLESRHIRKQIKRGKYNPKFWRKNMPYPEYKRLTIGVTFDKRDSLLVLKTKGYKLEGKDKILFKVNIETGKVTKHNFGKNDILGLDRSYFYMFKNDDDEPFTYRLSRKKINF